MNNPKINSHQLVSMLGLKAKRIDCCVKGCMLFYDNEYGKMMNDYYNVNL